MYHYTVIQWLFIFYFYCFGGWCIESTYVSIKDKKLTNRGFMRGPFLPIYGSGATMMLVVSMPFQGMGLPWRVVFTYIAGCIGATILEYITGVVMEALFKVRYWDYSNQKFNFQGHICLGSSLAWGLITISMTEFIHMPVEWVVMAIPGQLLTVVTLVLTAGIFADFALSFKAAVDLRNVLTKMKQVKEEMLAIQSRLDAIMASASESMGNYKEGLSRSASDLKKGIESRLESIKAIVLTRSGEYLESVKAELIDLRARYLVNKENHDRLSSLKDFFQREMIRSNPRMTSVEYREFLEELKEKVTRKRKAAETQEIAEEQETTETQEVSAGEEEKK
ncbi:MAG: putative ABC transporter permease [Acetatifactor sp.]|nr:putative ABC transporter permease [Acetatifactor sp.]